MKILLVSLCGDGCWFGWLLAKEGHTVTWTVSDPKYVEVMGGIVPEPVDVVDPPGQYDLIFYDMTGVGEIADAAREYTPVIGDSAFADQLEDDRIFGIETMEKAGIRVPPWEAFDDPAEAIRWLKKTHKRCVFKPIGDEDCSATYVAQSEQDMVRYMDILFKRMKIKKFLLQEFVQGTEVSTEAWFNGTDWCALNHTLEEKKFLSGGLGPNTGCAGNLCWMPSGSNPLFQRGLEKMKPILQEAGYVGMLDLNTIATESNIYGLEWTPRCGYEGTCNLTRLLPLPFGEFLYRVATGQTMNIADSRHRFAATVRLSVPPYPCAPKAKERKDSVPLDGIDTDHLENFYLVNAKVGENGLETAGCYDHQVGSPIGASETIAGAFAECQSLIDRLQIPDLQYRNDIRQCCEKRYETLLQQGWLKRI